MPMQNQSERDLVEKEKEEEKEKENEKNNVYCGSTLVFNAKPLGSVPKVVIAKSVYSSHKKEIEDNAAEFLTLVGKGFGLITAIVLYFAVKHQYKRIKNPIRTFEVWADVGFAVGDLLTSIPFPFPPVIQKLISILITDVVSIVFGLVIAIPYWLVTECFAKPNYDQYIPKSDSTLLTERWQKYGKQSIRMGRDAGKIIGFAIAADKSHSSQAIKLGGSIGSIGLFVVAIISIPLINRLFSRILISDPPEVQLFPSEQNISRAQKQKKISYYLRRNGESSSIIRINENGSEEEISTDNSILEKLSKIVNSCDLNLELPEENKKKIHYLICSYHEHVILDPKFRISYMKAGAALGLALGSIVGYILGVFIPGLGHIIGLSVGGAVCSLVGSVYFGIHGKKITEELHKDKNPENRWEYSTRTCSTLLGFIGAAIGLFIPIPGAAILVPAIFSAGGWFIGRYVIKKARQLSVTEENAKIAPWTLRVDVLASIGTCVGGIIGLVAGVMGGPLGMVAGAALGSAIGGFVCGIIGALYEKRSRDLIWEGIKSFFPFSPQKQEGSQALPLTPAPIPKIPIPMDEGSPSSRISPIQLPSTSPLDQTDNSHTIRRPDSAPPDQSSFNKQPNYSFSHSPQLLFSGSVDHNKEGKPLFKYDRKYDSSSLLSPV